MPAYLLPSVPVVQPPHLEGDASLATEILPGPPSAATVQQLALKRDPKKPSMAYSYLPPSDPGSTYSGIMHGTLIGLDLEGARSKRAKDKGYTFTFSIRFSVLLIFYCILSVYITFALWTSEPAGERNERLPVNRAPMLLLLLIPRLHLFRPCSRLHFLQLTQTILP